MIQHRKAISIAASVAILAGCQTIPTEPSKIPKSTIVSDAHEGGWHCYVTPNEKFYPGWMFRIAKDGKYFDVADVSDAAPPISSPRADQEFIRQGSWSLGTGFEILGAPVRADVRTNRMYTVTIRITQGSKETSLEATRAAAAAEIREGRIEILPGSRYFVVRKAIAAKQYLYELDAQFALDIGGEVELMEVLKASGSASCVSDKDEGNTAVVSAEKASQSDTAQSTSQNCEQIVDKFDRSFFRISQSFENPMRICYLPEEILITQDRADQPIKLEFAPVESTEQLWKDGSFIAP